MTDFSSYIEKIHRLDVMQSETDIVLPGVQTPVVAQIEFHGWNLGGSHWTVNGDDLAYDLVTHDAEVHEWYKQLSIDNGDIAAPYSAEIAKQWQAIALKWTRRSHSDVFSLPAETLALVKSAISSFASPKLPYSDKYEFPTRAINISDIELSSIICEQIELVFAALARRAISNGINRVMLGTSLEFETEIDILLQSRIPFPPRYFGHLSDQIFAQMQKPHILKKMEGSWGHFQKSPSGEIIMVITLDAIPDSGASLASYGIEEL